MPETVVILGGGFAGLAAARPLARLAARRPGLRVILVDRHPYTTMVPSLPDVAGGHIPATRLTVPLRAILPPAVSFHQATVTALDLDARTVETDAGPLSADRLILACGSAPRHPDSALHRGPVHTIGFLEDAEALRLAFRAHLASAPHPALVLAGGGYTGLELAASLQDAARSLGRPVDVTIVEHHATLLGAMPPWVGAYLARRIAARGLALVTGAQVEESDAGRVRLSNGRTIDHALLVWSAGSRFPIETVRGSVARTADGRFEVDAALRLPGPPGLDAAGDAAALRRDGALLRKAVNFARDSGRIAGLNCARELEGRPPLPFKPVDLGWIIPFGDTGVGQLFSRINVRGRLPLALHYAMCGLRHSSVAHRLFYWKTGLAALFARSASGIPAPAPRNGA